MGWLGLRHSCLTPNARLSRPSKNLVAAPLAAVAGAPARQQLTAGRSARACVRPVQLQAALPRVPLSLSKVGLGTNAWSAHPAGARVESCVKA